MKHRRHEYKTLWATIWELVTFSAKVLAIFCLLAGWLFVFYRDCYGH